MQDQDVFEKRLERAFYDHIRTDIGFDEDSSDTAFLEAQAVCKRHYDKLPFNNFSDAGKFMVSGLRITAWL
jgi:hypothetical protein